MNKNIKLMLIVTSFAGFLAFAHDDIRGLVNSSGDVVRNSSGDCVQAVTNPENINCRATPQQQEKPQKQIEVSFTIHAKTLFNTDKADLRDAEKSGLNGLAAKITGVGKIPELKRISSVKVIGHADSRGSVKYNQGLSERRATTVRTFLIEKGVSADIITSFGEGETNPVASNATAEGLQQNRRVNITVNGIAVAK